VAAAGAGAAGVAAAGAGAAGVAAAGPSSASRAAAAAPAAASDADGRLVYLLEYVGMDYGHAVQDGEVVDQAEYGEVLRLLKELARDYGARRGRSPAVAKGIAAIEKDVVARAPAEQVYAASRELLPKLVASLGGAPRPATVPDLASGRRLYAKDCAPCHGETGAGDGDGAAGLDPPPTPFRGPYLERLAPRQVFHALTHGMPGTAMASFADAYDERQRWDVAFFVPTLRVGFAPVAPRAAYAPSLEELASSSNADLLAALQKLDPSATPEQVDRLREDAGARAATATATARAGAGASASQAVDAAAEPGLAVALQLQDAFAGVAARVFPSVVGVTGYVKDAAWSPEQKRDAGGPLWTSAGIDALRYPGYRPVRSGSGFVVDEAGLVLTRDRLLRGGQDELAALVDVELADHTHRVATVVGSEPTLDLAVLQIAEPSDGTSQSPPPVALGDSDRLAIGQWVLALGDPPGNEQTFAVGIVSAPPVRQCYQQELSATRVQSSLAIPERALGGPVVDIQGRVVGLGVGEPRGAAPPPGSPGTGHVLPINLVLNLYEALKVAHSTRSPWLGISVLELDRMARSATTEKAKAALPVNGIGIDDVFVPSPAAAAGVQPGDFLVEMGGHAIQSVGDFQKWMYVLGIGARVELGLLRDGQPLRATVTIEARPAEATTS
ncbi:MAG: PDZ domain-containing protein, partial [Deltaproteobacteria bacterium]|nr:PDZ domain-containing protein [Deltaproteobacteria bacterium]